MDIDEALRQVRFVIEKYFSTRPAQPFTPGQTPIPLSTPSFGSEEIMEALQSLLSTEVTMGKKVKRFEALFADYIGVTNAVMVNSGSSANLLALAVLTNPTLSSHIRSGEEVITPAVTWATTVFPIINCGLLPVLVDVDPKTFNIDPNEIEKSITPRTRALMIVHLLGHPCNMEPIMDIARRYNLWLIEDSCEAHGAEYHGRKVGSFGDMATFSFYFSHHITTIEGGMLLTNNERLADMARAMRAFGWIRELRNKDELARQYPEIDSRFLFTNIGFNIRPTEIQGAFGIHQIAKLEKFIDVRRENARYWIESLNKYSDYISLPSEDEGVRHCWLGFPLTVRPTSPFSRSDLVNFLAAKGVDTRPIMAGNIEEQPAMALFPYRKVGVLPNAQLIHRHSFFFGNHSGIDRAAREAIVSYIDEFIATRKSGSVAKDLATKRATDNSCIPRRKSGSHPKQDA